MDGKHTSSPPSAPRISVVMPVHNVQAYLQGAIDGILGQSFADFEFIIVDDGSTDATPDILAAQSDARIRILRNAECRGIQFSLNRGVEAARGEFIARQDGDDISFPQRFAAQVRWLEAHPDSALVGTGGWVATCHGASRRVRVRPMLLMAKPHRIAARVICGANPFMHPSIMFRRSAIDAVGWYSMQRAHLCCEDYELWTRLVAHGLRLDNLRRPLMFYRTYTGGIAAELTATRPHENHDGTVRAQWHAMLGDAPPPCLQEALRAAQRLSAPAPADAAIDWAAVQRALRHLERTAIARAPTAARGLARAFSGIRLRLHCIRYLPNAAIRALRALAFALRAARNLPAWLRDRRYIAGCIRAGEWEKRG